MRKAIIAAGAAILLLLLLLLGTSPAIADTERVNAADNATRWESSGDACNVAVDDFSDHEVNVYCFAPGRTWFKVRVPGVSGRVTRLIARGRGDCSGKSVTARKRGDVATVKIANVGEFDCYYSTVLVRHTG